MNGFAEVGGFRLPLLETLMDWALFWAGQDIPVFPLHEVYSGVCTCSCTRKCRGGVHKCGAFCESKGKHPRWNRDDLPSGVENASLDFALIRRWWTRWPTANVGGRMGGASALVALDFDPRHGGDASLNDLIEAHGDGWTNTLTFKTGSGGFHFLFQYPASQVLRNSAGEVGPGVDTRGEGGYIVLPPSLHASGNLYEMFRVVPVIPAPEWLLEVFRPKANAQKVVNFQEYRERRTPTSGCGPTIVEGQRNTRLFKVGCALWGKGEVGSRAELFQRLMDENLARVSPPLDSAEVWALAENISGRYVHGGSAA
jgi:putative DNA primase/helicase